MTERIDHVAEAQRLMAEMSAMDGVTQPMAVTQKSLLITSHIGLASIEQQRIANLITVAGWVADSRAEDVGYDLDKLRTGVAGEVWEGLGIA